VTEIQTWPRAAKYVLLAAAVTGLLLLLAGWLRWLPAEARDAGMALAIIALAPQFYLGGKGLVKIAVVVLAPVLVASYGAHALRHVFPEQAYDVASLAQGVAGVLTFWVFFAERYMPLVRKPGKTGAWDD